MALGLQISCGRLPVEPGYRTALCMSGIAFARAESSLVPSKPLILHTLYFAWTETLSVIQACFLAVAVAEQTRRNKQIP